MRPRTRGASRTRRTGAKTKRTDAESRTRGARRTRRTGAGQGRDLPDGLALSTSAARPGHGGRRCSVRSLPSAPLCWREAAGSADAPDRRPIHAAGRPRQTVRLRGNAVGGHGRFTTRRFRRLHLRAIAAVRVCSAGKRAGVRERVTPGPGSGRYPGAIDALSQVLWGAEISASLSWFRSLDTHP